MSNFVQKAFDGGMNLLSDDVDLQPNQYRLGMNLRTRFGGPRGIPNGVEDTAAPLGIKQEIRTFGNYVILFCAGFAYYRLFSSTGWKRITSFQMSKVAPRYWTEIVPISAENYLRVLDTGIDAKAAISLNVISGSNNGNVSGLVVQDNISQPMFIYINPSTGLPVARNLQTFAQWDWDGTTTAVTADRREYVPIGNSMAWVDGILYIASKNGEKIYRSVSGRPLDFMVNITDAGTAGGDAETTAYSVGVGGISCLRAMSDGSLFVAAGNANFSVSKNMTPNATTLFGEYTFIRKFLFNATCLNDRCILDSLGDTKFIDITGVRSFNAILQTQNEGRNTVFSRMVQSVLEGFTQLGLRASCILYDNYEFYGLDTYLGPVIGVFDTLTNSWVGFDNAQTGGAYVKMFAKIELTIQRLYAITSDDKLYTLYSGTEYAPLMRTQSISPNNLTLGQNKVADQSEHKITKVRLSFNSVDADFDVEVTPIVQNELTPVGTMEKSWNFQPPTTEYTGAGKLSDNNLNIANLLFSMPNCSQGSRSYALVTWTTANELASISFDCTDITGNNNPLRSQGQ